MAKKPFKTEAEEEEYHRAMLRDMLRKLVTLAQEEPELANQLLGQLMLSGELLVSNMPGFKDDFRNLVKEVDQTVRQEASLPWRPVAGEPLEEK